MESIIVTGFKAAPPFARGLVRDLRVRWALEEAGLAHETMLIDAAERHGAASRAWHPFGKIPAFEADGVRLFESGAIVHRIALDHAALMPADAAGRADTLAWMFAALNTVEPPLVEVLDIDFVHAGEPWAAERRPGAEANARQRLAALDAWLAGRDYLLGRFTAADIMMATTLRFVRHTGLVAEHPAVAAYLARCEARPAFRRAEAAQLDDFARHAPIAA